MNTEQWCLPPSQVGMYQADGTCAWMKAWVELFSYTSSIVTCHSLLFIPYVKYVVKYTAALRAAALRNAFLYPYLLICLHSYNIYLSSSGFPPKNIIKIFFFLYPNINTIFNIFVWSKRASDIPLRFALWNELSMVNWSKRLYATFIPTSLEGSRNSYKPWKCLKIVSNNSSSLNLSK